MMLIKKNNRKGSAMVLALFAILLFMTMIVGFTYDSRSQSIYNAGFKLNSYYSQTARSVLAQYGADVLQAEWVPVPIAADPATVDTLRFSKLLQTAGTIGKYGLLLQANQSINQNLGNLPLEYNLWVTNNEDDPAVYLSGTKLHIGENKVLNPRWDTDSKVVVTVEIFDRNDSDKVPRAVVSALFGPSGSSEGQSYYDVGNLGNPTGDVGHQGADGNLSIQNLNDYR
ncbi:MAG: hypothetical protein CSA81_05675 [Acidobacteria bacterium]|nr:MAG: hypothetical protein CSA81_05675 [Acidobacteriota bacterium]PIE90920.1 MAG: hypothetical protein CR997_03430 [Acidobacteriota bacterium]